MSFLVKGGKHSDAEGVGSFQSTWNREQARRMATETWGVEEGWVLISVLITGWTEQARG